MKNLTRLLVLALPAALLALPAVAAGSPVVSQDPSGAPAAQDTAQVHMQPDCPFSWAVARIKCKKDATGAAVGIYGGAEVSLFCSGDKAEQALCVSGFSYGVRMSSENDVSVDCFFQGNGVLNESCGDVQLTIN